jgi:hypothetical protein
MRAGVKQVRSLKRTNDDPCRHPSFHPLPRPRRAVVAKDEESREKLTAVAAAARRMGRTRQSFACITRGFWVAFAWHAPPMGALVVWGWAHGTAGSDRTVDVKAPLCWHGGQGGSARSLPTQNSVSGTNHTRHKTLSLSLCPTFLCPTAEHKSTSHRGQVLLESGNAQHRTDVGQEAYNPPTLVSFTNVFSGLCRVH